MPSRTLDKIDFNTRIVPVQKAFSLFTRRSNHRPIHGFRLSSENDRRGVGRELWVLLIGGGAIVMAFTYIFGTPDLVVHVCAVALTAALMAFVIYLIFALEHPFVGTLSVKPDAYMHVLEIWSQPPTR